MDCQSGDSDFQLEKYDHSAKEVQHKVSIKLGTSISNVERQQGVIMRTGVHQRLKHSLQRQSQVKKNLFLIWELFEMRILWDWGSLLGNGLRTSFAGTWRKQDWAEWIIELWLGHNKGFGLSHKELWSWVDPSVLFRIEARGQALVPSHKPRCRLKSGRECEPGKEVSLAEGNF